ncbi:TIR domain-containing protein [Sulfitobacter faviae]|uniref:TIR domain-containing protein n=1 Tax=Sulfitobacter faviae TaxID=1775881 RepID=UPI00398C871F
MTNVFISWSGDTSRKIAEELHGWIPSVLQFAKPYFTPNDVEKGSKWSSEIAQKLSETHVGIICLTRDNYQKPWILFEAGALSKDLGKSKVCSVLFGMENTDLSGPLATFQTTNFDKDDFRKMLGTINDAGESNHLPKETFDRVFEMWWPQLEKKIQGIMVEEHAQVRGELRSERELLEEVLSLSRLLARKTKSDERLFSPNALFHIVKSASGLLDDALTHSDSNIFEAVVELSDAATHIARGT